MYKSGSHTLKNITIVNSHSASDYKESLFRIKGSYPRPEDCEPFGLVS